LKGGYERKSTGHTDVEKATRIATDRYDALWYEQRKGRDALPKSFLQVSKLYTEWLEKYVAAGKAKKVRLDSARNFLNHALLPYFGNKTIDTMKEKDIAGYWEWRRALKKTKSVGRGKVVPTNETVGDVTIGLELSLVRSIMKFAIERDIMERSAVPQFGWGKAKKERRPAFTGEQLDKLYEISFKWINSDPDQRVQFRRTRIQALMLVLGHSGIRVGEARELRWAQIVGKGKQHLLVDGKTGRREVQPMPLADEALTHWRIYQTQFFGKAPRDTDYVFQDHDHSKLGDPAQGFKALLKLARITHDPYGDPYTIYSLRHFYATNRLEAGISDFIIGMNMGTSAEMLRRYYGHVRSAAARKELDKGTENPAWEAFEAKEVAPSRAALGMPPLDKSER
jgi:integrase